MTPDISTNARLQIAAAKLYSVSVNAKRHVETRVAELDFLIHEAQAREFRRAAFNLEDRHAYRLGGAFKPVGGSELDHVALTGWLALGTTGLLLLTEVALREPGGSIVDHLGSLFASAAGESIRAYGSWVRWKWLRELYLEETKRFFASKKGRDLKARWRSAKPTVNQVYLVAQICIDLELQNRTFATRGDAFDWIRKVDGNPRFADDLPPPSVAGLLEALQ